MDTSSRHKRTCAELGGTALDLFGLSPSYGILTARAAHDWFLGMMRENEEFEVETDRAGEPPLSFWSETVRRVVLE